MASTINTSDNTQEDTIDLTEVFNTLRSSKRLIYIISSSIFLLTVIYSFSLSNIYQSVAVVNLQDKSSEQADLSRFSGLASIAGISMPNSGLNDGALVIETIGSRRFLSILLEHDDILPSLVVAQSYDATN